MTDTKIKPIHEMTQQELMCKQAKVRDELRHHIAEVQVLNEELDYIDAALETKKGK